MMSSRSDRALGKENGEGVETVAEGNDDPVEGDWDTAVKETAFVGLTVEGPDKDRDAEHKEEGVNAK